MEYVYIVREREFITSGQNIYKIGKTTQNPEDRFKAYPKGTEVIITLKVNNCSDTELNIKLVFDKKFQQRKDIGREYYQGDIEEMKKQC